MRHLTMHRGRRGWFAALAVVTLLSLLAVFAAPGQAADEPSPVAAVAAQSQVFNDDLTVDSGQVLEGDVVVYDGDVQVQDGGLIRGNLIVYSGDIAVDSGGSVEGDVTSFSGDVEVEGRVTGSVSAWSGDVRLGDEAYVGGDISVMSGDINRAHGSAVEGNIVRGPGLKLPAMAPQVPGFGSAPLTPQPLSLMGQLFGFFGRLLGAIFLLGLAILVGAGLLLWKPTWVEEVRTTLHEHTALTFAVGILVNALALAVIGVLWVLVCTRPPALLMGLALLGLNLAGLAALGDEIGRRVEVRLKRSYVPAVRMAIGLLVPGIVLGILYILGFCFGIFASLGMLVLASFGAGAVLVKLLKLGTPGPETTYALAPASTTLAAESAADGETPPAVATAPGTAEPPAITPAAASDLEPGETTPAVPSAEDVEAPAERASALEAMPVTEVSTPESEPFTSQTRPGASWSRQPRLMISPALSASARHSTSACRRRASARTPSWRARRPKRSRPRSAGPKSAWRRPDYRASSKAGRVVVRQS